MVVVIKDANKLTLEKLSSARDKLVSRAQAGEQMPEDLQGGTFTITNLGMFGIKSFDPLIIPGQSGILGVGLLQVEETGIEMINVTLACDHRIVSGVDGARFLQTFSEYFSEPKKMFNI
jgi:pyruvate dehydrogenase E2 component (dihydrolipoamide acetyltransferase)